MNNTCSFARGINRLFCGIYIKLTFASEDNGWTDLYYFINGHKLCFKTATVTPKGDEDDIIITKELNTQKRSTFKGQLIYVKGGDNDGRSASISRGN